MPETGEESEKLDSMSEKHKWQEQKQHKDKEYWWREERKEECEGHSGTYE